MIDFTPSPVLAICAVEKNESRYILEWLAFHMLSGANTFIIFDNESTDGTYELLVALSKHYNIDCRLWKPTEGVSPQASAYNEGLRIARGKYDFVAFIDIDEFLYCADRSLLSEFLARVDPDISAIAINQRVFGSSDHLSYTPDLVTARFIRRAHVQYEENRYFKSVSRPSNVAAIETAHSVTLRTGRYAFSNGAHLHRELGTHPGRADIIIDGQLILHHYILKSFEEFKMKQTRGGVWGNTSQVRMSRYSNDGFFHWRDQILNQAPDLALLSDREAIIRKIGEMLGRIRDEFDAESVLRFCPREVASLLYNH